MGNLTPDLMAFSGPTWGALYPRPPHFYRGAKNLIFTYQVAAESVIDLLPEEAEPMGATTGMVLWFQDTPFSTFGPHRATYAWIECTFRGNPYYFEAFLWVTSESAMAAGREFWGDSKKLADISFDFVKEEVVAKLERPVGSVIAAGRMRLERFADVSEMPQHPGLCLKYIPDAERDMPPAVLQLVMDDFTGGPVIGSDGRAEIYAGAGTIDFGAVGDLDPLTKLRPIGPVTALYTVMNFELDFGTVLKDYHNPSRA